MDTTVTPDRPPDRQRKITPPAVPMSSPVQTDCPERAPFLTEQRLAGGRAQRSGAPPGRREPVHRSGLEAEGKIKGRGTSWREKAVCTWGWRGTRQGAAACREGAQRRVGIGEVACFARRTALALDGGPA